MLSDTILSCQSSSFTCKSSLDKGSRSITKGSVSQSGCNPVKTRIFLVGKKNCPFKITNKKKRKHTCLNASSHFDRSWHTEHEVYAVSQSTATKLKFSVYQELNSNRLDILKFTLAFLLLFSPAKQVKKPTSEYLNSRV